MVMNKGRGELRGIAKIALIVSVLMIGLTPLANAAITEFTITPNTLESCQETLFVVEVKANESGTWQNTSIPSGCSFIPPTVPGVPIVSTEFWDDSGYVGNVTIKTTDTLGQVEVTAIIDGFECTNTQTISFNPGDTFTITSPCGGPSKVEGRVPTDTEDGWFNVSSSMPLKDFRDEWLVQICCPEPGVPLVFTATAEGDLVGMNDYVVCEYPAVPAYNSLGLAALVGIMSVVLGLATVRRKR